MLRERAAQLVKHLEPEDVDGPGGLQLIFDTLEASPLLKQHEKHRVDWHRKRLLSLSRVSGRAWSHTSLGLDYIGINLIRRSPWVKGSLWATCWITHGSLERSVR